MKYSSQALKSVSISLRPYLRTVVRVGLTDLSLSRGEAPKHQRQSGGPLAATNVKTAGSVRKRRDAVRLGRKKGASAPSQRTARRRLQ